MLLDVGQPLGGICQIAFVVIPQCLFFQSLN